MREHGVKTLRLVKMCSRWVATVRGHDEFGTKS
jgi:hypothetical protein